ncbi:hypothetical protein ACOMHN_031782 [Nucella lapillus]
MTGEGSCAPAVNYSLSHVWLPVGDFHGVNREVTWAWQRQQLKSNHGQALEACGDVTGEGSCAPAVNYSLSRVWLPVGDFHGVNREGQSQG